MMGNLIGLQGKEGVGPNPPVALQRSILFSDGQGCAFRRERVLC